MTHLFGCLEDVFSRMKAGPVFLFLDFDGTLAPLARTPREAVLPAGLADLLHRLSTLAAVKLAVVSGRRLDDLRQKVGIDGIIYSGNHGLECKGPGIAFDPGIDESLLNQLSEMAQGLRKEMAVFKGAEVEDKKYSVSVHYRNVSAADHDALLRAVKAVLMPYQQADGFVLTYGKMVAEIRLNTNWNKGKIVRWLLDRFPGTAPIYLGDDRTDEDAFAVVRPLGLAVLVGEGQGDSQADFFLRDPAEVQKFLEFLYNRFNKDR